MEYKKAQWTGLEQQAPTPKLEIFTKGNPGTPDFTYTHDPKAGEWSKLLEYEFIESIDDLEGSFTFSVENEGIGGDTIFGQIPKRSVVKIYEGGVKPVFIGIIRHFQVEAAMTAQGPKRKITFSGKSITSCIVEYTVSLDVRIHNVADPTDKNIKLTDKLARDGLTINDFMKETWEHFKEVSEDNGISTTGIADVINKFIGGPDKFIKVLGTEKELRYNVACIFYNAGNNVIADVWRNILPDPVYELFSRCEDGEPKIIARQVPFEPGDWSGMDLYEISPISLIAYDLHQSDEEVYTAFASYIIGSVMRKQFYMATGQENDNDSVVVHDTEKQAIYGFKPLEAAFNGYDRQGNMNGEKRGELKEALKGLNEMLKDWYSRLDDMYFGSLTICTDFNNPETNPRAGCRAWFLGAEFYINSAHHSWQFGGTPTIKLAISRGIGVNATKHFSELEMYLRPVRKKIAELK
jgi:hypothetical protein